MARVTIKRVNAALKAAGFKAELVKGDSYFYFTGDDPWGWFCTSVYVYHLSSYTVEGWVNEARRLAEETKQYSF